MSVLNRLLSVVLALALMMPTYVDAKGGSSSSGGRSGGSSFSGSRSSGSSFGGSRSGSSGFSGSRGGSSGFSGSRPSAPKPSFSSPSRSTPSGFGSKPSAAPTPSRSSPSSFSGTKSTPTSKPVATSPPKSGFSSTNNSVSKSTPKPQTPVDIKAAKMVKVGNTTMTKDQAVAKFKQDNASKYTSKYATEPASRPSHIPSTTNVGGANVNIVYNSSYGGYGYYNSVGRWMFYDTMADVAMMSMLMNNHGYVGYAAPAPVVYTGPSYAGTFFLIFFLLFGLVIVGIVVSGNRRSW